jgi:argininosuccinate lyase
MKPVIFIVKKLDDYRLIKYHGINAAKDPMLLCTDFMEYLIRWYHVPMRKSHGIIGRLVRLSEEVDEEINKLTYDQCKEAVPLIGKLMNEKEFNQMINEVFDFEKAMSKRDTVGAPGTEQVKKQLKRWNKTLRNRPNRPRPSFNCGMD